jgi:hypothetical protein
MFERFRYVQDKDGHLVKRSLNKAEEKLEFATERMMAHDNRTCGSGSLLTQLGSVAIIGQNAITRVEL